MVNIVISQGLKFSQGCEDEDMEMQILINLNFSYAGSLEDNGKFIVQASVTDTQNSTELEFELPLVTEIKKTYELWREIYHDLLPPAKVKGFKKSNKNLIPPNEKCQKFVEILHNQVNQWLLPIKLELEKLLEIKLDSDIRFVVNTQNIESETIAETLHKIPWREWDLFPDCYALEATLCLNEIESNSASIANDGIFRRVRIISVFGDTKDIKEEVDQDKEEIKKLERRGAELIHLEQPLRQDLKKLWDEICDIFFYSGHSISEKNSTAGYFQINKDDNLSLEEIKNTFHEAIKKGLKIAIFNSCDGLGLAYELVKLGLPYVIVWRELVPGKIAQKFIEYFLSSYSQGKPFLDSVRDARIQLKELTNTKDTKNQIPGLNWLPIICVSTKDEPPLWEDLGGLTGKLPDSPYQGLSAFGEEDAPYFFGRKKFVDELVEAVNTKSLVPIIGASGSGKSSVVFAGLVPQLRKSGMQIVSFRPGNNPFDSLAIAYALRTRFANGRAIFIGDAPLRLNALTRINLEFNNRLQELELEVNLEQDEKALCRFIEDLSNLTSKRFILIIDQFEELYTQTPQPQQQPFINALLYAVEHAPNFCLVFTLRADFYGHAISHFEFSENLDKNNHNCSPMNSEQLRAVIEQPAAKMRVELESGLADKLIDELGNQAGSLPLLEFALLLLWEKHDKWYLTHQAYKEIGGLKQALAKYADGVINPLSAVDKEKAQRIFIQLISPGEGTEDTKRKATRGEVGEDNWDLVEFLANHRLVVTGWDENNKNQTVEIIHEALIREWGMLRGWIKSNRRFRIWQERLQVEVVKWKDEKHDEKYLLSGGNLGEAEGWYFDEKYRNYLSDSQGKFIRESLEKREREEKEKKRQQQEKAKLQKRAIKWLSGGLVAASLATGFAGWNWGKAEISATASKINSFRVNSEYLFGLQQHENALIECIKGNELLENTWWKSFIQTSVKHKAKVALNNAINFIKIENYTLIGDKSSVYVVRFSSDGKVIASVSEDETVKLWNRNNGQLRHTLKAHKDRVIDVKFSPDGKVIASASADDTVKLWNRDNGQLLHTLKGHDYDVYDLRFSPDSKVIASASGDGTVKLWNRDNGQLLHTLKGHESSVYDVRFSSDGKVIASASGDSEWSSDRTVKLWNRDNGQLLHTLEGHKGSVHKVKFSPDGKVIASASADDTVKLWNRDNGQLLHTLKAHKDRVINVKFSPDGKVIASASDDKTVKLWNRDNGQLLHTLEAHKSSVNEVRFSPDGKVIASASGDGTVKLWNRNNGQLLHTLEGHKSDVYDVRFSSDGKVITSASEDGTVKLWNRDNSQLLHTLEGHKNSVNEVKFSPDGKVIASISDDNTVKLWNRDNGQLLHTLKGHKTSVNKVKFSPTGKVIASTSDDNTVKLWNRDNGQLLYILIGHKNRVNDVRFSPDGKVISSASGRGIVELWNEDNGELLPVHQAKIVRWRQAWEAGGGNNFYSLLIRLVIPSYTLSLSKHRFSVNEVKFSPDGKVIASASSDKTVRLWNTDNGQLLYTLKGHKSLVNEVRFSPDGEVIASASSDKTVRLWNTDNGQLLHTFSGHKDAVNEVKFSPDGKVIASASWNNTRSQDNTVKLWNRHNGQLLHTLSGHKDSVYKVSFNRDGEVIASASRDGTVKLWNTDNGQLLHTLSGHKGLVTDVRFSPDSKIIASTSEDGTVKLWNWDFDNLITRGCIRLKDYFVENPAKLEELKVCQNPKILTKGILIKAASTLVRQGEELAKDGDYETAVQKFSTAKKWNPKLDINPEEKAKVNN